MKINEYVSYAGRGLGKVVELKTIELMANKTEFLSIQILDSGMKIMIPKDSTDFVRPLMNKETATKCLQLIREPSSYNPDNRGATWNRRNRMLLEKIKSNNPIQIAEVIAELLTRKADGEDLSFGERKCMDAARALIDKEIEMVMK